MATPEIKTTNALKEQNKRIGGALAGQMFSGLEAWARQAQLLADDNTNDASPRFAIDAFTKAFCETPDDGWFAGGSPLARDGAAYMFARILFPDIVPDADTAEADSLDGFAQTAFMIARAALLAGIASRNRVWLADGAEFLLQSAAVVATRLVEEGQSVQAEAAAVGSVVDSVEGSSDNG